MTPEVQQSRLQKCQTPGQGSSGKLTKKKPSLSPQFQGPRKP